MNARFTTVGSTRFLTYSNDAFVSKSIEVYGEWSYGEVELISKLLRPNSNVIEIGSNIGAHTVFIARDVCPAGMVYAFEPRRLLFQMLCANLALNGVTNVFAFQKAVGSKRDYVEEGVQPSGSANIGGYAIGSIEGKGEAIEIVPLDQMLSLLAPISLLKADVEGWERDVILGSKKLVERDRPILYVENDRLEKSRDLIVSICDLDYILWWHIVRLFRPNNRAGTRANIFGNISSINMLCLPKERNANVTGMRRVEDPSDHPLKKG